MIGSECSAPEREHELSVQKDGYSSQHEGTPTPEEVRPAKRKAADERTSDRPPTGKRMRMSTGGRMPRPAAPLEPLPQKTGLIPAP